MTAYTITGGNGINKITKFGGMYDTDMNQDLYLLHNETITSDQYEDIKLYVGPIFPDGQVIKKSAESFVLRTDGATAECKKYVNEVVKTKSGQQDVPFNI